MSNKKSTAEEILANLPTDEDWEAFEKHHEKIKRLKKFHEETKGIPNFMKLRKI